ncbi:AAA family ATPase [Nocardia brasiliensis]|uniref:AAA family ATPase n=1 Tax=Nocardia brasiliensis TaxID=37326 RepID=UPI00189415E8|nr:AAA family ATPase [Nocardia brasiliensis]MBF6544801.1 AAA family ATPase [Nocardia brasiliensis]
MPQLLVLINGLPGSGKTTLGPQLARVLNGRCLSKDTVKEALAGVGDSDVPELGGIAMDALWTTASTIPGTVLIDSWWFRPRDLEFARAGIEKTAADRAVEVWCAVAPELARERYRRRCRAALHRDERRLTDDWLAWAQRAEPLGLTPTVLVDTAGPIDCMTLAGRVEKAARPYPFPRSLA